MSITPYTKIKDFKLSDGILTDNAIVKAVSDQTTIEYSLNNHKVSKTKLLEPVRLVEGSNQLALDIPRTVLADDLVLANEESQLNGLNVSIVHCSQYPVNDTDIAPKQYLYDRLLVEKATPRVVAFLMKDSKNNDLYSVSIENSKLKLRKIVFGKIQILQKTCIEDFIPQLQEITRILSNPVIPINVVEADDIFEIFNQIVDTFPISTAMPIENPDTFYDLASNINFYITEKNKEL